MGLIGFFQTLRSAVIFLTLTAFIATLVQALFFSPRNNNFISNSPLSERMLHLT